VNLTAIQLNVSELFGDLAKAQVTDAFIMHWANEANNDIARKTECLQEIAQINVVAGTGNYPLPIDFIKEKRVTLDGKLIRRATLEYADRYYPDRDANVYNGTPHSYYFFENNIYLLPPPATSGTNNLDFWYIRYPAVLTAGGDTPEIPEQFHDDIVQYCYARALQHDESFTAAVEAMRAYEARIMVTASEVYTPDGTSYGAVRLLPGDDW
jgi:hypothetical protein